MAILLEGVVARTLERGLLEVLEEEEAKLTRYSDYENFMQWNITLEKPTFPINTNKHELLLNIQ